MGKTRAQSPNLPRSLGYQRMATLPMRAVVEALGIEHHARSAYWRLVEIGEDAVPAVRAGLQHPNPAVRRGVCEFLDLYWDEDAAVEMQELLSDPDATVRRMAAHALTCARCKNDTWEKKAVRRVAR